MFNKIKQLDSQLTELYSSVGIQDIVVGMPHRGRLNLLTGLMKYPTAEMFSKVAILCAFLSKPWISFSIFLVF